MCCRYCQPCRANAGQRRRCILCPKEGGALKNVKDSQDWAHLSCALWIPETVIENSVFKVHVVCCSSFQDRMEPINVGLVSAKRYSLLCSLCEREQGACVQCAVQPAIKGWLSQFSAQDVRNALPRHLCIRESTSDGHVLGRPWLCPQAVLPKTPLLPGLSVLSSESRQLFKAF